MRSARIDWKHGPRLGLYDAGFDASAPCAFRDRLVAGEATWLLA